MSNQEWQDMTGWELPQPNPNDRRCSPYCILPGCHEKVWTPNELADWNRQVRNALHSSR